MYSAYYLSFTTDGVLVFNVKEFNLLKMQIFVF